MERRPSIAADELSLKILAFLRKNSGQSYTVKELATEHSIYSSPDEIQKKITNLLKRGLIRVQNRGREIGYQII